MVKSKYNMPYWKKQNLALLNLNLRLPGTRSFASYLSQFQFVKLFYKQIWIFKNKTKKHLLKKENKNMSLSNYIKKNCISYSNTENYHSRTLVAVSCSCRAKRNRRIRVFKSNKNSFAKVKKQKYH